MLIKQNLFMGIKEIVIIGAGGFGREVKCLIDQINTEKSKFNLIGFIDDKLPIGTIVNGIQVIGDLEFLIKTEKNISIAIGIGDPIVKREIVNKLSSINFDFPNLIHPNAIISSDSVVFGKGNIISAGNIITCNILFHNYITLNLFCTVGHDTIIKDFASLMPSVNISGEVLINECVYVGTGAKIINKLEIGKNVTIGAGAVVTKDLPDHCTAVGIPAKPIKFHSEI